MKIAGIIKYCKPAPSQCLSSSSEILDPYESCAPDSHFVSLALETVYTYISGDVAIHDTQESWD